MMDKNIKAIIFDLGGVLYNLDINRTLVGLKNLGIPVGDVFTRTIQKGIFEKIDKGLVSEQYFFDYLRKASGNKDLKDADLLKAWNSCLVDLPKERLECLARVRKHYPIYLLSNTNVMHWRMTEEKDFPYQGLKAEELFSGLFLSFRMHVHKPEKELFKAVIEALPFKPEECLFIDDAAPNIVAAEEAGIHGHLEPANSGEWMQLFEHLK